MTKQFSKKSTFSPLADLFSKYIPNDDKGYISREFQDFGYRLAAELDDLKHKSLYIKLSKEVDRAILEQARTFVIDADNAKSKARLFMWKVKQLREAMEKKVATKKVSTKKI